MVASTYREGRETAQGFQIGMKSPRRGYLIQNLPSFLRVVFTCFARRLVLSMD